MIIVIKFNTQDTYLIIRNNICDITSIVKISVQLQNINVGIRTFSNIENEIEFLLII